MFFKKKKIFRNLSIEEIKEKTRVLFIDDQNRNDIIEYLSKSGWKCRQLFERDFDTLDAIDIKDSQIICVDINGVGEKLGKNNGLDIVKSIKTKTPNKKIIIYSSQTTQNIFHEAVDLADKKIFKSAGDFEVFKNAIEELSKTIFSWDEMVLTSYEKVKPYYGDELTLELYKTKLEKMSSKKSFSVEQLEVAFKISTRIATLVFEGVKLFK